MARNFQRERAAQLAKEMSATTDQIIDEIRPLLAGRSPMTQGAIVAELCAIWLGGHRPEIRNELLDVFIDTAVKMIALHDAWRK
jgi:hypothetical protein